MNISQKGLEVIKGFEGCRLKAYLCPAGVWTIGYGHTKTASPGQVISKEKAEELLRGDLEGFEEGVGDILTSKNVDPTQGQFDALVSFSFNVGLHALQKSTLLSKLSNGDIEGAAKEFSRWNRAGGRVLLGLVARRNAEKKLFLS